MFAWKNAVSLAVALTTAFAASSCTSEEAGPQGPPLTCASDLDEIVTLLQSGLPDYEYDPAPGLGALIEQSSAVVTGSLGSFFRSDVDDPGAISGVDAWTAITPESSMVIAESQRSEVEVLEFAFSSRQPEDADPDPISDRIGTSNVTFVAFLHHFGPAPGGYLAYGLAIGCAGSGEPPIPILRPFPADVDGLSVEELVLHVRAVAQDLAATIALSLDGPVIRHPQQSDNEEGDSAEIRGTLELDGDCLYIKDKDESERYPTVWPNGTTWDGENRIVIIPNGDRLGIGDAVYGGGGYWYVDAIPNIVSQEAATLAAGCVDNASGEIAVVNNYDDAISRSG